MNNKHVTECSEYLFNHIYFPFSISILEEKNPFNFNTQDAIIFHSSYNFDKQI